MRKQIALGLALVGATMGSAFAAVDPLITTAIGDMKTDGVAVASGFVLAAIVVAAVKFLRSAK